MTGTVRMYGGRGVRLRGTEIVGRAHERSTSEKEMIDVAMYRGRAHVRSTSEKHGYRDGCCGNVSRKGP